MSNMYRAGAVDESNKPPLIAGGRLKARVDFYDFFSAFLIICFASHRKKQVWKGLFFFFRYIPFHGKRTPKRYDS